MKLSLWTPFSAGGVERTSRVSPKDVYLDDQPRHIIVLDDVVPGSFPKGTKRVLSGRSIGIGNADHAVEFSHWPVKHLYEGKINKQGVSVESSETSRGNIYGPGRSVSKYLLVYTHRIRSDRSEYPADRRDRDCL